MPLANITNACTVAVVATFLVAMPKYRKKQFKDRDVYLGSHLEGTDH